VLQMPDVKQQLSNAGAIPAGMAPSEFGDFLKSEVAKWGEAVTRSGAKSE
jgi:tripartite-type tricarboxylate transporter receptor subunit TctC